MNRKSEKLFLSQQLEFLKISREQNIVVGASNLVNSSNWTGELWYFQNEELIFSDNKTGNGSSTCYPLIFSIADGTFVDNDKVLVGNDRGTLALYTVTNTRRSCDSEDMTTPKCSFYNNVCSTLHDRSILSVSVSQHGHGNKKAITGSMDCSIKIWDLENFVPEITYNSAHAHHVTSVRFKNEISETELGPSELFVSASLDGYCLLWDRRKQFPACVVSKAQNVGYTTVEWFDDSCDKIFLGSENGDLIFVDIRYMKEFKPLYINSQSFNRNINAIRVCSYDSTKFVAVCEDSHTFKVFEFENDDTLKEIYRNSEHKDYVRDLAWLITANEQKLFSCSWDSQMMKHYPFHTLHNNTTDSI